MRILQCDVLVRFSSSVVLKIPKSEDSRHISAFKSRENVWKMEREAAVDLADSSQVYNGHQPVSQCSDNKKMPHWATKTQPFNS